MPYIKNKHGRITEVDESRLADLLKQHGMTAPNDEEIAIYKAERQAIYNKLQDKEPTHDSRVFFCTVTQNANGYGASSRCIIDELKRIGISASLHNEGQDIGLLYHAPFTLPSMNTPYRVVYTMFESTRIPDEWDEYLPDADMILVPSKWVAGVFGEKGYTTKVVPLGYNSRVFTYRAREEKRKNRKPFVFLHYEAFNARKGFMELWKAWTDTFEKDEPVKLILKTVRNTAPFPIPKSEYPNVEVITGAMSEGELADLCASADCFVFPSRGEGFGITPLEAMATGLPAIVPNAHGITEYFDKDYMYEVKVEGQCPALYSKYKEGVGTMSLCDVKHLGQQMRWVYEHEEEAREMGKKASEYVKQWTYEHTARHLAQVFKEVRLLKSKNRRLERLPLVRL